MSKRTADAELGDTPLKGGDRPEKMDVDDNNKEMGEFEDEFEDEFESEDEILEAGVDGRPDAEREAEEKARGLTRRPQMPWTSTKGHSSSAEARSSPARPSLPI
ncbi:hypothetical protein NM208_g13998 [Fusarium decemcellulare]|uniref:Uncharacterized protein n=1 Tax=Fusarium decemcellulare TaxID=57161 RepID=A0ACC1RJ63_9HYPO|nr:hypothetical protein NM208_g13998 [Fusarium decemcellulare]